MKKNNSFSISFNQRSDKVDKSNTAPIYMRVTISGKRVEIATKKRFDVSRWKDGHPTGNKFDAKELEKDLDSMKAKVNNIYRDLVDRRELITAEKIKDCFVGKNDRSKTIIEAFEFHEEYINKLKDVEYAPATIKRYETCLRHIKAFLSYQYKTSDMYLSELDYAFITNLEYYFKVVRKCNHNTSIKYIKNFRKIVNLAIKHDWLDKDPFSRYTTKFEEVERDYLTREELSRLETKTIMNKRLNQVKDIFVFCCYTGLAHVDVLNLKSNNIVMDINGRKFIYINREKTNTKAKIMLLEKAEYLIEKYKDEPKKIEGALLPVSSNQKMNVYLKEIADLCEIEKNLTFHIARHTFATTVTLTNGVPIETVSAMLGHKNIRTTQIYSKVVDLKISNDMTDLENKLKENERKIKNSNFKK